MSTVAHEIFLEPGPRHDKYVDELRSHKHRLARITGWVNLPRMWVLTDSARSQDAVREVVKAQLAPVTQRSATVEERLPKRAISEHVQAQLLKLVRDRQIARLAAVRALKEMLYVLPADAVFPHVAADENGEVAFYWFAGNSRLEVLVPEHGEIYCRASGLSSSVLFESFSAHAPVRELRGAIEEITSVIMASNPDWQRVFDS